jgi:hypothetical protein
MQEPGRAGAQVGWIGQVERLSALTGSGATL